jgi:hypothetical protein
MRAARIRRQVPGFDMDAPNLLARDIVPSGFVTSGALTNQHRFTVSARSLRSPPSSRRPAADVCA